MIPSPFSRISSRPGSNDKPTKQLGQDGPNVFQAPSLRHFIYEEDVHRDLTTVLALAVGFSDAEAIAIGNNDQWTDEDPFHRPMPPTFWDWFSPWEQFNNLRSRYKYHFPTEEELQALWTEFAAKASSRRNEALLALGVYLHAYQDAHYAHAGFGFWWGHLFYGHEPDKPFMNPHNSIEMAHLTYERLDEAYKLLEAKRGQNQYNADLKPVGEQYNDKKVRFEEIQGKVEEFVHARDHVMIQNPNAYFTYQPDIEFHGPAEVPTDDIEDPRIKEEEERVLCDLESFLRKQQGRTDLLARCVRSKSRI